MSRGTTSDQTSLMLKLPSYQRAKRRMLKIGHEILAAHRAKTPAKKDLIDDILDASQKPDFQETLGTEEQIVLVMATLFHLFRLERFHPEAKLRVKRDPIPTLRNAFRSSLYERKKGDVR